MKNIVVIMLIVLILVGCVVFLSNRYNEGANRVFKEVIRFSGWLSDISAIKKDLDINMDASEYHIFVRFKEIGGLKTGDKVRYNGRVVGICEIYQVDPKDKLKYTILIKINDRNVRLKDNSNIYINTLGSGKEKYVEILSDEKAGGYLMKGACVEGEDIEFWPKSPTLPAR